MFEKSTVLNWLECVDIFLGITDFEYIYNKL